MKTTTSTPMEPHWTPEGKRAVQQMLLEVRTAARAHRDKDTPTWRKALTSNRSPATAGSERRAPHINRAALRHICPPKATRLDKPARPRQRRTCPGGRRRP